MANRVEAVYLDVGKVIMDFQGGLDALASKFGVGLPEVTTAWLEHDSDTCKGIISIHELWNRLKVKFDYRGEDIDFPEFWSSFFKPIQETHDLMKEISPIVSMGLFTNVYTGMLAVAMSRGIVPTHNYFAVVQSCDHGLAKPDKQLFRVAGSLARVDSNQILFVDDRNENIEMAQQMHWQTVHFDPKSPQQSVNEIRKKLNL